VARGGGGKGKGVAECAGAAVAGDGSGSDTGSPADADAVACVICLDNKQGLHSLLLLSFVTLSVPQLCLGKARAGKVTSEFTS